MLSSRRRPPMSTTKPSPDRRPAWASRNTRWRIDPSRSRIEFRTPTFWGLVTVRGRFEHYDGTLDLRHEPAVELTIDASSLDTNNNKRDKHLRSPHFFDVDNHPTGPLRVRRRHAGGRAANWSAAGSIRGKERVRRSTSTPSCGVPVMNWKSKLVPRPTIAWSMDPPAHSAMIRTPGRADRPWPAGQPARRD